MFASGLPEPVFGVLALKSEPVASRLRHPARTVTGKRQALKGRNLQPPCSNRSPKSFSPSAERLAGRAPRGVFWFDQGALKAGSLGNARRKTLRKVPIPMSDSPMTPGPDESVGSSSSTHSRSSQEKQTSRSSW